MAKVNRVAKDDTPPKSKSYFMQGWDAYDSQPEANVYDAVAEVEIISSVYRQWWVDGFVSHRETNERAATERRKGS